MHALNDSELRGLIVEETGQPHDSAPVKWILSCIRNLKNFANFAPAPTAEAPILVERIDGQAKPSTNSVQLNTARGIGLNLGYTINLNLPASTDPAVFDAIFRAIKEHLLSEDDG